MVKTIAELHGRKILFISIPQFLLRMIPVSTTKKLFGNLICDCLPDKENAVSDFYITIYLTEQEDREL